MYKYNDIKTVHLEITQRCQAACPMCDRNENGGVVNKHLTDAELSLDDCKNIFPPLFIKQLKTMYMCGNLGDPLLASDTLEVFKYFREHNPTMWLSMNTNGGARDSAWWKELANVFGKHGTVIFSVDGLEDTNHLYRQNVVWDKVANAMKSFISAGGRARWDYIIFDHNQHQVDEAELLATSWGVEKFIKKKTGRFFSSASNKGKQEHQSQNRKGVSTILLKKPDKKFQNSSLSKEDALIDKYGSMLDYYNSCKINCKVKTEGSIFVTAEGLALPCCWTAGRMYKWWQSDPTVEPIWKLINEVGGKDKLNTKRGLSEVFNSGIFDAIEQSWFKNSCSDGKLQVCAMKCGEEFDPFGDQYK